MKINFDQLILRVIVDHSLVFMFSSRVILLKLSKKSVCLLFQICADLNMKLKYVKTIYICISKLPLHSFRR